jgi:carbonic anhydrase
VEMNNDIVSQHDGRSAMDVIDTLVARNDDFARTRFAPGMPILPRLRTLVLTCVDPRLDPADLLGLELGDAAVIRNVGGRVTPDVLTQLDLLSGLAQTLVGEAAPTVDLVVLQHTDCGITRMQDPPDKLAPFFGADPADRHVADPRSAVVADVAVLRNSPKVSARYRITGAVYDVATGRFDVVEHHA